MISVSMIGEEKLRKRNILVSSPEMHKNNYHEKLAEVVKVQQVDFKDNITSLEGSFIYLNIYYQNIINNMLPRQYYLVLGI